jgi:autotransporter-associated beta strand protein
MIVGLEGGLGTFTASGGTVSVGSGGGSNLFVGRRTEDVAGNVAYVSTMNLGGATMFTANVATLGIGTVTGSGGSQGRPGGTLILAADNNVTATNIVIGDSAGVGLGGHTNTLTLGAANTIAATNITVSGSKSTSLLNFAAPGSTLNLGTSGSRVNLRIGNQTSSTGGGSNGTVNFAGSTVNAFLNQFVIATKPNTATGATTGAVTFDTGTINTNSLSLGVRTAAGTAGAVTGTLNHNGGTVTVNGTVADGGGVANVNLSGGTLQFVTLDKTTSAFNFTFNSGTIQNVTGQNLTNNDVNVQLAGAGPHTFNVDASRTATILAAANITGSGAAAKNGDGSLVFPGTITYTGTTAVSAGTLQVNGSTAAGNALTLSGTGTLAGTGTVGGTVQANPSSTLSPGVAGTGILNTGAANLVASAKFDVQLNGTTVGSGYDRLAVNGAADISGSMLVLSGSLVAVPGNSMTILTSTGLTGEFTGLPNATTLFLNGAPLEITYTATDVILSFDTTIVINADDDTPVAGKLDNDIIVRRNGLNIEVEVDGGLVLDTPYANITTLTINGQTGHDVTTVQFGGGLDPVPSGGLRFNGDGNTPNDGRIPAGDRLIVTGGAFDSATFTYGNQGGPANDGSIELVTGGTTDTITFTGLEPVDTTGSTATDVILNLPTGADVATLTDNGATLTINAPTFELTAFAQPTGSLTINGGSDDTLTITNALGFGAADLSATAGTINADGVTRFAGHVGLAAALSSLTTDSPGTTVFAGTADTAISVAPSGMQAYLPFDVIGVPGAGQTPDNSGNGRNGTLTGSLASGNPVAGFIDNAIDYKNNTDHVC